MSYCRITCPDHLTFDRLLCNGQTLHLPLLSFAVVVLVFLLPLLRYVLCDEDKEVRVLNVEHTWVRAKSFCWSCVNCSHSLRIWSSTCA